MPGFSQLSQFVDKANSLGDELQVRRMRGEAVEEIKVPDGIADIDDSDDFLYGLPDTEDAEAAASEAASAAAEDEALKAALDEIAGGSSASDASADADAAAEQTPTDDGAVDPDVLAALQEATGGADTSTAPDAADDFADPLSGLGLDDLPDLGDLPDKNETPDVSPIDSLDALSGLGEADTANAADGESDSAFDVDALNLDDLGDIGNDTVSGTGETGSADADASTGAGSDSGSIDDFEDPFAGMEAFDESDSVTGAADSVSAPSLDDIASLGTESTDSPALPTDADTDSAADATDDIESFMSDFTPGDGADDAISAGGADSVSGGDEGVPSLDDIGDMDADPFAASGATADTTGETDIASQTDETAAPIDLGGDGELPDFGNDADDFDSDGIIDEIAKDADTSGGFELNTDNFASDSGGDFDPTAGIGGDFDTNPFDNIPSPSPDGIDDSDNPSDAVGDFVIEGFSDVPDAAAAAEKAKKQKQKKEAADAKAAAKTKKEDPKDLAPDQFTDEEFSKFNEQLHYYPLNLRLEIEQLLVDDQFTDEENIKIIRMVIKKTGVRQMASYIGKLLDKVIDVPRDYDRRTVAQYEAYKQTAEYQLKNRILPAALAILVIGIFVSSFAYLMYTFAYKPIMSEKYYREGYAQIEADAFPESWESFRKASEYKNKKKWFFKFADAYREKRQYASAERVYTWLLRIFPKDKNGGLQYAEMELYEVKDYEKAESVVRREVLDKFVNDPDGMLLLGDVYLEWATDKDPSKFAEARRVYESIIDMYGQTDQTLARMLRYYIRTDNLREVLPIKKYFYPDKKTGPKRIKLLEARDVLEMSEYLLNKFYGTLTPAEVYLRDYIEDVRGLLEAAIKADPTVPEAYYNYARYFMYSANISAAQTTLSEALNVFDAAKDRPPKRILKNIDTYRLLGELYIDQQEYLKAEELLVKGISLFEDEREPSGLVASRDIGKLYADMADIDYFISGDNEQALRNYTHATESDYDTPSIRYRIGYIQYGKKNYLDALVSFIKSADEHATDLNLLLALGNVLTLRDDDFAAQGYYERFMNEFTKVRTLEGVMFPQVQAEHGELVQNYMYAANNYAVALNKLASKTGNSNQNARAMVYFSESARAWDALTRNQQTMIRLDGSNLASQNMKYLSYPQSQFEPALYYDLPRTLQDEEILVQPTLKSGR